MGNLTVSFYQNPHKFLFFENHSEKQTVLSSISVLLYTLYIFAKFGAFFWTILALTIRTVSRYGHS